MSTFTLDGKTIEFKQGQTIIEAARDAGITIPHFCWHPALTVAGNCRICLVEIEKAPKGAIACATLAAENMVVYANSPKAEHMRNAVMEFLLINHPLDCPICDEAGECKLQDYAYNYGVGESRFDEIKTHKDKRVELGPHVMFDAERCISCSRCIRYCEEIVEDPQLTFVQRGEHVTIETFPGKKLDNPYSMNVIEICPVGALTSREFRFRARVWDMSKTESICTGCARGCNTNIWVRDNEIMRLTPRENMDVNEYWMCDYGRNSTFKYVNDIKSRISNPMVRSLQDGILSDTSSGMIQTDWDNAISRVLTELKNYKPEEIAFIASPFTTLEDNYILKKFAKEVVGTDNIFYIPDIKGEDDDFLLRADKTPNSTGLELLGIEALAASQLSGIKLLYVIQDNIARLHVPVNSDVIISHVSNMNESSVRSTVVFPASTYAEMNGTIMNFQGRIQRLRSAVATLEVEKLPCDFSLSRLDKFGAHNDRWSHGPKFNARPAWMIISQVARALKHDFDFNNTEEVFDDMVKNIPVLSGITYTQIGTSGIPIEIAVNA